MSRRRVVALFRRVVSEIRRDRPSLALLFIAPIVITGLVTFILRESQAPQVTAVVVNLAGARGQLAGDALGAALRTGGATVTTCADEAAARASIADRSASVGIVIRTGAASGSPLDDQRDHERPRPVRRREPGRRGPAGRRWPRSRPRPGRPSPSSSTRPSTGPRPTTRSRRSRRRSSPSSPTSSSTSSPA